MKKYQKQSEKRDFGEIQAGNESEWVGEHF